jgi:chemotaxis protein MotA
MAFSSLIDPLSAAIVVGGTFMASLLQCGLHDGAAALGAVGRLLRPRFDPGRARAELAAPIADLRLDGVVRGRKSRLGDPEIDEATEALIGGRSVTALIAMHEHHRARREHTNGRARATLSHASELAPVFGLAGTLVALTRLADGQVVDTMLSAAIGSAVLTTLYGLLLAHIVLAPLARAVDRFARNEERSRQEIIDWLVGQLEPAIPRRRSTDRATDSRAPS